MKDALLNSKGIFFKLPETLIHSISAHFLPFIQISVVLVGGDVEVYLQNANKSLLVDHFKSFGSMVQSNNDTFLNIAVPFYFQHRWDFFPFRIKT